MFSNGKTYINVKTVGQAIEELKRLPPDMPMNQEYDGNGADIVIFNRDLEDPHVEFTGGGEWDEDTEQGDGEDDTDGEDVPQAMEYPSQKEMKEWVDRAIANGKTILRYECPNCRGELFAMQPPRGEIYDSMVCCPSCLKLHFRITHSTGEIELR